MRAEDNNRTFEAAQRGKKEKHKYMLRDHVTIRIKASKVWLDVIRGNIFQWGRNVYVSEDNDEFKVSS